MWHATSFRLHQPMWLLPHSSPWPHSRWNLGNSWFLSTGSACLLSNVGRELKKTVTENFCWGGEGGIKQFLAKKSDNHPLKRGRGCDGIFCDLCFWALSLISIHTRSYLCTDAGSKPMHTELHRSDGNSFYVFIFSYATVFFLQNILAMGV